MKRLYFRFVLGFVVVLALSFFLPRLVLETLDRPEFRQQGPPLSPATLVLLRDWLNGLSPDQIPNALDSLTPVLGHSLTLVPESDTSVSALGWDTLKDDIMFERGRPRERDRQMDSGRMPMSDRPPGPGQMMDRRRPFGSPRPDAYVRLQSAHQVLILRPSGGPKPTARSLVILITVVLVISLVAGFIMVAPMVRNLKKLQTATSRFGQGDLNARASVRARDAVGSVAGQFNVMADGIQRQIERERELLQAVSHEMRTPIARIRFSLDMLKTSESEADRNRRMQEIDDEIVEIDALVGELIDYNRLRSSTMMLNRESLEVGPMLEETVERLKELRRDVTVRLVPSPEEPCMIVADRPALRRVIQNLLLNALRYAKSQAVIQYGRQGDAVRIDVSDDGPGIPESERQRVFEPFVRVDDSRSKESGGVGLGLAIVNRIMKLHGGSIQVDQADIGGAHFVTIWPDNPPDL
jgi:signal transduction histidine kinase